MTTQNEHKAGYKKTKLGWIPVEWEMVKLGDIVKVSSGKGLSSKKIIHGQYPVYGGNGFINYHNDFKYEKPKIIIGRVGAKCGCIHITKRNSWITDNALIVSKKTLQVYDLFLYYLLCKMDINKYADKNAQPVISGSKMYSISTVLPPLPEQQKIADILSTWDEAIQSTQELIKAKQQQKKALMQQLLTGKVRLPGFSGEWEQQSIDFLFEKTGRYVEWDDNEVYPLVSIRRRYGGLFHRANQLGKTIGVKKLKTIMTGDFLISKRQVSHGAWVVVKDEFEGGKVSNEYDCLRIKHEDKLNPEFWSWFCQQPIMTHYAFLDSIGVHIEKLIFHYNLFKKRKVLLPKLIEEQKAIAQVLTTADEEIEILKDKLGQLQAQKKGLMQQLLTGAVRVKVDGQSKKR